MFDFNQMGRLMELARDIDADDLVELAEKVDLPELISVIRRLDDDQLVHFEAEVRRAAGMVREGEPVVLGAEPPKYPPFTRAAVLGAGTMGAQIAAHLANIGLDVLLLDIAAEDADPNAIVRRGLEQARNLRPDPFFDDRAAERIRLGNFDDDIAEISDAEWIIEAVVERLDVKRSLMARVEQHAGEGAVISTNTSGIPIHEIAEGRSDSFRRRFLGTHFFNPPRYLKLLELIPTADTHRDVLERIASFGRVHLGKGIVVAKDVPYFIGNRIGIYGQLQAMRYFTDGGFSIEEIDLLTGPLIGRPKSATFRTADVVGLDVLKSVAENLHAKVEHDESRQAFQVPDLLARLVAEKRLGAKTDAGFYRKRGRVIESVNPETLEYQAPEGTRFRDVEKLMAQPLPQRLHSLYEDEGPAGRFFRENTLDLLGYAARRVPEVTDNPADIDRAIRWGFGWDLGPFQQWDILGFERVRRDMRDAGIVLPEWIDDLASSEKSGFYRESDHSISVYRPEEREYVSDPRPPDRIALREMAGRSIWSNDEAALLDVGDGVAVFEIRSHGNALSVPVVQGLQDAIDVVESRADLRGMVIGNEGKNFSVGANLFEVVRAIEDGNFDWLERFVAEFQDTMMRIRYARKPIVAAVHQRVLGGACELLMAAPMAVAAAESYIGLVELGVGLIPGGTGATHLAWRASERAPNGHASEIQAALQVYFENVAMARVSSSAEHARQLGYLPDSSTIVMNEDRRLFVAKRVVQQLSDAGYRPPPRRRRIKVLGRPTRAAFEVQLQQYVEGNFISDYDRVLASQLAYILTGGDFSGPQDVPEEYLIELEREAILRLLGESKTQDRIRHMLKTGKPLRN